MRLLSLYVLVPLFSAASSLELVGKLTGGIGNIAQVGNEFSSVEALWSQFENVMAKDPEDEAGKADEGGPEGQPQGEGEDDADKTAVAGKSD